MFNDKLSFLSKYVRGIKASEKRLKLFEYFRILNTAVGFVFLQETLLSRCRKKNGKTSFKNNCFSHGKTNYCGVAIGYYGKKVFQTSEQVILIFSFKSFISCCLSISLV